MANWCSNYLYCDNEKVIAVFKRLAKKEKKEKQGQTLNYFKDDRYLFEIDTDYDPITFETKWGPAINTVINLSKKYKCQIELEYSEPMMEVYGKIFAKNGKHLHVYLDDIDFMQYEYNEELDTYIYQGKEYDGQEEILDDLLIKKINEQDLGNI